MHSSGYSGTPLARKLGLKDGFTVRLVNAPPYYWDLFTDIPQNLKILDRATRDLDLVHLFATNTTALHQGLPACMKQIKPDGIIWVSWPKKASGVVTDITEDTIRAFALDIGLVDVKVCAVDATWSALKLVIPVKRRTQ
ncbi:MAG TPA: hypothetical protein VG870_02400 [Chitinophagaceae bacterium]|nr:hypothetical protein [Chitinophagaceae bacterium]